MNTSIARIISDLLIHVPTLVEEVEAVFNDTKASPEGVQKAVTAITDMAKLLDTLAHSL